MTRSVASLRVPVRVVAIVGSLLLPLAGGCAEARPDSPPTEASAEGVSGRAPPAVHGIPSVLTLHTPSSADLNADQERPLMVQLALEFWPAELLVGVGQRMVVTNNESLAHNVHVRFADTDSTVFDIDTLTGQSLEFVFEREGGYDVVCDIHPGMRALIYATTTPYAAFADDEGDFHFSGVPPGTYTLAVWSLDPELRSERTIEVSGVSTEVEFGPLP